MVPGGYLTIPGGYLTVSWRLSRGSWRLSQQGVGIELPGQLKTQGTRKGGVELGQQVRQARRRHSYLQPKSCHLVPDQGIKPIVRINSMELH